MIEFLKRWAKNLRFVVHKCAVLLAFILTMVTLTAVPMIVAGVAIGFPIGFLFGGGVGVGVGFFVSFFTAISFMATLDIDKFTDYFEQYMPD